jgi:NADPH:quinone reductase-like Zn-dependent oxidoreductase
LRPRGRASDVYEARRFVSVIDVGGAATLARALEALAFDGHVAMIGTLSGSAETIPTAPLFDAGARLTAIYVGSRADFEAMNAFIVEHDLHPVIDRVFEFEEAAAAFDLMANGDYMGKIVVRVR